MHAGRIDENNLALGFCNYTLNPKTRRLWFIRDGRNLLAYEPIEES